MLCDELVGDLVGEVGGDRVDLRAVALQLGRGFAQLAWIACYQGDVPLVLDEHGRDR